MTDLSALERLYAAATQGRWVHDPDWRDDGASQILQAANTNLAVCFMATGMDKDEHEATAELIVALHNAFPALLAELRALREDAERLDALQSMTTGYGIGWVLRLSTSGRGMRLHETSAGTAFATVRAAIDARTAARKP